MIVLKNNKYYKYWPDLVNGEDIPPSVRLGAFQHLEGLVIFIVKIIRTKHTFCTKYFELLVISEHRLMGL